MVTGRLVLPFGKGGNWKIPLQNYMTSIMRRTALGSTVAHYNALPRQVEPTISMHQLNQALASIGMRIDELIADPLMAWDYRQLFVFKFHYKTKS